MNVRDTSPHFLFPQTTEKLSFSEKKQEVLLNIPANVSVAKIKALSENLASRNKLLSVDKRG